MPEETKSTDLATTGSTELARPSFLPTHDLRGTEHITKDDLQMPKLGLAQALSPQVQKTEPQYIAGLQVGQLFNNLTKHNYGEGPLEFTIIRADPPRFVEFIPRSEGGGVKDVNVPPNDPRTKFRTDEAGKTIPPVATKFYDFVLLLLPTREPIALSLKSTGLKVARQLNALMKLRNAPSFAGKYVMTTGTSKNAKGVFAVYQVQNAGWVDEDTFNFCSQMYEAFKDKTLIIDRESDIHVPAGDDTDFDTSKM
jgi:hypothetical protein